MKKSPTPTQRIEREVREDGTIEVDVSPIISGNISAYNEDADGVRHYGFCTEQELRAVANVPDDYHLQFFRPNKRR